MFKKQTRVVFTGVFWQVRVMHCGVWVTLRDLFLTRREARISAKFHAIN